MERGVIMMRNIGTQRTIAGTVALFLTGYASVTYAQCNQPGEWFRVPGNDIKLVAGYKYEQAGFEDLGVTSAEADQPYPTTFPDAPSGERKEVGVLSKQDTSYISYFERDSKQQWRICRIEVWLPPNAGDETTRAARLAMSKEYASTNPKLAALTKGHIALYATMFSYDGRGRVVQVEVADFDNRGRQAQMRICRRYDEKNRVVLKLNPHVTQRCTEGAPDVRDQWLRYAYGEYDGKPVKLLEEWHYGDETRWKKKFDMFRVGPQPGAVWGAALAKSGKGVTTIYGSNTGKLDDNSANTVLDSFGHWTGSTYFFTRPPVPLEVLEHPELVYKYERRRQTYIDGHQFKLFELFKPNEHISHHRYYYAGEMVRSEQLDAKGKVTRVVTVDDYRQPRPGPHPDVDDKLFTDKGLRIIGHQIYHRIYDLDAQGRPTLVAISWNRKLRLNPLKRTPMDFADVVFGTPDGKVRWKTLAEFEKFFGFSSNAAEVFPDEIGRSAEEDD
jgi:hypothetical protein